MSEAEWEEVEGSGEITWWKVTEMSEGDEWEGVYVEPMYKTFEDGGQGVSYKILDTDGELVGFNGSGQLKAKMNDIEPGSYIRIVFEGTKDVGKENPLGLFSVYKCSKLTEDMRALMKEAEQHRSKPKAAAASGGDRQIAGADPKAGF